MREDTYAFTDRKTPLENMEWDHSWIEQTGNRDALRVMYIGDSISRAVRQMATEASKETLLFDGFASSKALDNPWLPESLALWGKQLPGEAGILFNNGLHGWHLEDRTEYSAWYEKTITFLNTRFSLPTVILLTTSVEDPAREARVQERNRQAVEIAGKYHLPVIDLYSLSKTLAHLHTPDGVHFTQEAYRRFAAKIVQELKPILCP